MQKDIELIINEFLYAGKLRVVLHGRPICSKEDQLSFVFVFCFLRNKNTLIRCDSLHTADFLSIT
jgi:hypothetical protein